MALPAARLATGRRCPRASLLALALAIALVTPFGVAPAWCDDASVRSLVEQINTLIASKNEPETTAAKNGPPSKADLKDARDSAKVVSDFAAKLMSTALSVSLTATADDSPDRDDSSVITTIDFRRGLYPIEYRVRLDANLRSAAAKDIDKEVTSTLLNIDQHPNHFTELFAFAERFRDNFMSIQRRHELGVGWKLEFDVTHLVPKGQGLERAIRHFGGMPPWLAPPMTGAKIADTPKARGKRRSTETDPLFAPTSSPPRPPLPTVKTIGGRTANETLEASDDDDKKIAASARKIVEQEHVLRAIPKQFGLLSAGIAVSAFVEIEQARIQSQVTGASISETRDFFLPDRQRFRMALRPSLVLRPVDALTLSGRIYWKLPLGDTTDDEGRYDRRIDADAAAVMSFAEDAVGTSQADVSLEVRYARDDAPPRLSSSTLDNLRTLGLTAATTKAQREHLALVFKITLKMK